MPIWFDRATKFGMVTHMGQGRVSLGSGSASIPSSGGPAYPPPKKKMDALLTPIRFDKQRPNLVRNTCRARACFYGVSQGPLGLSVSKFFETFPSE